MSQQLVIEQLALDIMALEEEVASYRLVSQAALEQLHDAIERHDALVLRYRELREELRRYMATQCGS